MWWILINFVKFVAGYVANLENELKNLRKQFEKKRKIFSVKLLSRHVINEPDVSIGEDGVIKFTGKYEFNL